MNIALILAGGTGTRLGSDIPKQYIKVDNKMIISYCLETLLMHEAVDAVQIVADNMWADDIRMEIAALCMQSRELSDSELKNKLHGISSPGDNRQLSIVNGMRDILTYAGRDSVVLIHDAARPLLSAQMITDCFTKIVGHDGVMPVLPMKDTVYLSDDGISVSRLIDRSRIYAGQAPEAFVLGRYYDACMSLTPEKLLEINGSSEPAVMAGLDIAMFPGDEDNFKITTKQDLEKFRNLRTFS